MERRLRLPAGSRDGLGTTSRGHCPPASPVCRPFGMAGRDCRDHYRDFGGHFPSREVDGAGSPFGKILTAFPALDPALPGKRQGMWRRDGADSTPGIAELLAQQSRCVTLVAGAESLPCQTLPAPSWILIPEGLELIFIYQRLLMRPPSDAPALRWSG